MIFDSRFPIFDWVSRPPGVRRSVCLLSSVVCLLLSGCVSSRGRAPAATHIEPQPVRVPAKILSHFFLVESGQSDGKTYRFMIDTGSSATLVSPALASALRLKEKGPPRTMRVRGANGAEVEKSNVKWKNAPGRDPSAS